MNKSRKDKKEVCKESIDGKHIFDRWNYIYGCWTSKVEDSCWKCVACEKLKGLRGKDADLNSHAK